MQTWMKFLNQHPKPHLVVGWTRNIQSWRDDAFFELVDAQRPFGKYSSKRDIDPDRGRYLVLAAFEREQDARKLARLLDARTIKKYPGYASQSGFKYGGKLAKSLTDIMKSKKVAG